MKSDIGLLNNRTVEWIDTCIDEIADLTVGFVGKTTNHYVNNGIRFLRSQNVEPFRINLTDEKYIDEEFHRSIPKSQLEPGYVVIVRTGNPGASAVIPEKNEEWNCSDLVIIKPDHNKVNSTYLAAYLNLSYGVINSNLVGAVQQHFNVGSAKKLRIKLPPLKEQSIVARFIDSLNEKIATNEKINQNLEQQAAGVFYERFITNANPSWREGTISDLGTVVGGSTPSKAKPEYYTDHGIAWITPKDLSVDKSKFISRGADDITELGLRNSSASIMPSGTVLFSSRAPIGYIAIADGEVTTNQGFKSVVPHENVGTAFVYYFLRNALPTIENMASGTTFKEISGSAMKAVPAIVPDSISLKAFSDFCDPIFQEQRTLEAENRRLSTIRDTLLPKLMSGELDVSEIEL